MDEWDEGELEMRDHLEECVASLKDTNEALRHDPTDAALLELKIDLEIAIQSNKDTLQFIAPLENP